MSNLAEQFIFEDKGGKNLHLEHIEDEILIRVERIYILNT